MIYQTHSKKGFYEDHFVIWYKRLEAHRFPWPKRFDVDELTLSGRQLNWLLDGIDVWRMKPHDELKFLFTT